MTRINLVDPEELHAKHLTAELHEITRVFGLVRKAQDRKINKYNVDKLKIPAAYTMGTGHVKFFFNKLKFITDRYYTLCSEAKQRGYKVNPIERQSLVSGIDAWWFGDYVPTQEALNINRERINERLKEMKGKQK